MKMLPREISRSDATRVHQDLAQGVTIDWSLIEVPIAPEDVHQPSIDPEALHRSLLDLKRQYPASLGQRSQDGVAFDSQAAVLIHKSLGLDDATASRQEFWAWLSLRFFWDTINWRHGGGSDHAIPENFSITKRHHGLLERLWFRAELGQSDGKNPYRFVQTAPDRDFWESGVVRRSFCCCRPVARAFVRHQFESGRGRLHLTDPKGVRELYKRMSRIYATVGLDVLDEEQAYSLISDLARDLKRSGKNTKSTLAGR